MFFFLFQANEARFKACFGGLAGSSWLACDERCDWKEVYEIICWKLSLSNPYFQFIKGLGRLFPTFSAIGEKRKKNTRCPIFSFPLCLPAFHLGWKFLFLKGSKKSILEGREKKRNVFELRGCEPRKLFFVFRLEELPSVTIKFPDPTFHKFKASKSIDRRFRTT